MMERKTERLYDVSPDLPDWDDPRLNALLDGSMTQLEFLRLIRSTDPWEVRDGVLRPVDKEELARRKAQFEANAVARLIETGGFTTKILKDHKNVFRELYPEIMSDFDRIEKEIAAEKCVGCAANKKLRPVWDAILAAEPVKDSPLLKKLPILVAKRLRGETISQEEAREAVVYPPVFEKIYPPVKFRKPDLSRFKKISPEDFWNRENHYLTMYPEIAAEWAEAKKKIEDASCTKCERNRLERALKRRIRAIETERGIPGPSKPDNPPLAAGGPRPDCLDCVRKHVGQAIVELNESLQGYPQHRWLAVAQLAEAADEAVAAYPDLAAKLRARRLLIMEREGDYPNLMDLFDICDETEGPGTGKAPAGKRKLILRNFQSPGDIVMLTAAVRDLMTAHGDKFEVAVRTSCPDLWDNNPWLTPLDEEDPEVEIIDMEYPLVHRSNDLPYHFIHGFRMFLEDRLDLRIPAGPFKGDIHLSDEERAWTGQYEELTGRDEPFWIVNAGGKTDYTCKIWPADRWQAVVDGMNERGMRCAQIGLDAPDHLHPDLKGVLDLRGKTTLRELVRLIYHSSGVMGPVSASMHLAAAVPARPDRVRGLRPAVIVAGGREATHWEEYPGHQFLHTIGRLDCCAGGGCWRSRVKPTEKEDEGTTSHLCVDLVGETPRCMTMIQPSDVLRAVGVEPVGVTTGTDHVRDVAFVTLADDDYLPGAMALCHSLRRWHSEPIYFWHRLKDEANLERLREYAEGRDITLLEVPADMKDQPGWYYKPRVVRDTPSRKFVFLDADTLATHKLAEALDVVDAGFIWGVKAAVAAFPAMMTPLEAEVRAVDPRLIDERHKLLTAGICGWDKRVFPSLADDWVAETERLKGKKGVYGDMGPFNWVLARDGLWDKVHYEGDSLLCGTLWSDAQNTVFEDGLFLRRTPDCRGVVSLVHYNGMKPWKAGDKWTKPEAGRLDNPASLRLWRDVDRSLKKGDDHWTPEKQI